MPIVDGGFSLQYSPLLEYREGKGLVLFCQMDVTGRTELDPAAETLVRNLIRYVSTWKPAPRRRAVYVGGPAGRHHLEFAGIAPGTYEGGELTASQVLVVGQGGGPQLAENKESIADFVNPRRPHTGPGARSLRSERLFTVSNSDEAARNTLLRSSSPTARTASSPGSGLPTSTTATHARFLW